VARRIPLNEIPDGPPIEEVLAEIKALYFKTTAATIERDFDRAIDLLKTMPQAEDRQRATVYMDGLAQMRREWKSRKRRAGKPPGA
jgi:hypothetical protein